MPLAELFGDTILLTTLCVTIRQLPPPYRLVKTAAHPSDLVYTIFTRLAAFATAHTLPIPPHILSLQFNQLLRSLITAPLSTRPPIYTTLSQTATSLYKATNKTTHLFTAGKRREKLH